MIFLDRGRELWVGMGLLLVLVSGCSTPKSGVDAVAGRGLPRNVFVAGTHFPGDFKRVAVLPLAIVGEDAILENGRDALAPILQSELIRSARFEVVQVSPEQCRQWTGKTSWLTTDVLPVDFFERIHQATACDGVLFCQLTRYRAYPPTAMGWRAQLIAHDPVKVWWAVDEIFDGGDPLVEDAAKAYYKVHFATPTGADPDSMLASPRRFGQFTLTALVESLPLR